MRTVEEIMHEIRYLEKAEGKHHFDTVQISPYFKISVQAGSFPYSTPRRDYGDLSPYSKVEYAIFKTGHEKIWNPMRSRHGKDMDWRGEFECDDVAAYQPWDNVENAVKNLLCLSEIMEAKKSRK